MFKVQEGAIAGYAPSTEMVTKVALFLHLYATSERIKLPNKEYAKSNLETAFKITSC